MKDKAFEEMRTRVNDAFKRTGVCYTGVEFPTLMGRINDGFDYLDKIWLDPATKDDHFLAALAKWEDYWMSMIGCLQVMVRPTLPSL